MCYSTYDESSACALLCPLDFILKKLIIVTTHKNDFPFYDISKVCCISSIAPITIPLAQQLKDHDGTNEYSDKNKKTQELLLHHEQ
jgi:hypothetical protein